MLGLSGVSRGLSAQFEDNGFLRVFAPLGRKEVGRWLCVRCGVGWRLLADERLFSFVGVRGLCVGS